MVPLRVPRGTDSPSPALGCPAPQKDADIRHGGAGAPGMRSCHPHGVESAPPKLSPQSWHLTAPGTHGCYSSHTLHGWLGAPASAQPKSIHTTSRPHCANVASSCWGSMAATWGSSRVRPCLWLPRLSEPQFVQEESEGAELRPWEKRCRAHRQRLRGGGSHESLLPTR